ncbi:MAG: restriction endonuclease subunit S [Brachymonas denitrificans]
MSFPKYPAYKNSGVEWLGEVPEHWDVRPLKYGMRLLTEKSNRRTNPVALENIEGWSGRFVPTETEFIGDGVAFEEGDILFGKLRPYLAKAFLASRSGEAVGDFHVLRPVRGLVPRFAQQQLLERTFIEIVDGSTFGSKMPRASWDFIGSMPMLVPPPDEQTTIANFLDRETAKIDALVTEQERLIALLKEKRQAVISHAVTKGLDPSVPMKDSGVEWLGEVPEHWAVKPIKHLASLFGGATPSREVLAYWHGAIPWVSPKDMKAESITDSEEKITDAGLKSCATSLVPQGTALLVVRSGILKHTIPVAINKCPVSLNQDMKALSFQPSVMSSRFFLRFVQGLNDTLLLQWSKQGATVESLEQNYLVNTSIPVPPTHEQTAIATFLDRETAKIDALVAEAQRAITVLQERRSALISAAVTGQIDVRQHARQG